jgi:hypothetical protein
MAKFYGKIGYVRTIESEPGIWTEEATEREYYGDIIRNSRNLNSSNEINDSINISNNISVVADPYAKENFQYMRYVIFMGVKWTISNVLIEYPRIILTIGGVYNGK